VTLRRLIIKTAIDAGRFSRTAIFASTTLVAQCEYAFDKITRVPATALRQPVDSTMVLVAARTSPAPRVGLPGKPEKCQSSRQSGSHLGNPSFIAADATEPAGCAASIVAARTAT
jgi:hypothetical protein